MKWLSVAVFSLSLMALGVAACGGDDDDETGETPTTDGADMSGTDGADTDSDTDGTDSDTDGTDSNDGSDEGDGTDGGTGEPDLCAACESDGDCGSGKCIADARGESFCSRTCGYFGDDACPDSYYCKQTGTTANDFYCWPLDGVCAIDGLDCSPCRVEADDDCGPGLFCFEPVGGIGFCVRECEGAGTCPYAGMECGHHEKHTASICLPKIDGVPTAKCGARPLGFCEPCTTQGQCSTGICVESDNIGNVCSKPCDGDIDCPSGTDCVQGACVPPIGHGCQGFLSCLGVSCGPNEICHKGFCIDAP